MIKLKGGYNNMKKIIIASYSFIAAIIGAGFASGQEILSFFVIYGKWGIAGIIISVLIFGSFAYFVIHESKKIGTDSYCLFLRNEMGSNLGNISVWITIIFSVCTFAVMTACFSEIMYLFFEIDKKISRVIFGIICIAAVSAGSHKALQFNGILGIIIVIGIISSTLYILRFREHQTFSPNISAVISGAGYSGYNLIGSGIVLTKLSSDLKDNRSGLMVALISSAGLFVMMSLIYCLLSIYYKYLDLSEIPMLVLAIRENKIIACFYMIMMQLAVITTAVSSCVGVSELTGKNIGISSVFTCVVGIIAGGAGFSNLINYVYRICGYIGIMMIVYIFTKKIIKNIKIREILSK